MAQEEHVSLIYQGTKVWNQWRQDNPELQPDLYAANLQGLVGHGMDLSGVVLSVAMLNHADFSGANLRCANLSSANLTGAILKQADLYGADCRGINLTEADLSGARLEGVDLRSATLPSANLQDTDLSGANLSSCLVQTAENLTLEQLEKVQTLWLTELGKRMDLVQQHCPQLLLRPSR